VPFLLRLRLLLHPRCTRLLGHGRYAIARRVSEHRGRDGDYADEWHTTFELTTDDGHVVRHQVSARHADAYRDEEPIVYDPAWPEHAVLLCEVPGAPTIREDGTIVPSAL
jgi:hypothetical protein